MFKFKAIIRLLPFLILILTSPLSNAGESKTSQQVYDEAVGGINEVLDAYGVKDQKAAVTAPKSKPSQGEGSSGSKSDKGSAEPGKKKNNTPSNTNRGNQILRNTINQGISTTLQGVVNQPHPSQVYPDRDYSNSSFSVAPPPPMVAAPAGSGSNASAPVASAASSNTNTTPSGKPVWNSQSQNTAGVSGTGTSSAGAGSSQGAVASGKPVWNDTPKPSQNTGGTENNRQDTLTAKGLISSSKPVFESVKEPVVNQSLLSSAAGLNLLEQAAATTALFTDLGLPLPQGVETIESWANTIINAGKGGLQDNLDYYENKISRAESVADMLSGYPSIDTRKEKPIETFDPSKVLEGKAAVRRTDDYGHVKGATIYHRPDLQTWTPEKGDPVNGSIRSDGQIWSEYHGSWVDREVWEADEASFEKFSMEQALKEMEIQKGWDRFYAENAEPPLDAGIYEAASKLAVTDHKWALIDKVRKSSLNFDEQTILNLEKRMEEAIQKGAGPKDLEALLKSFYQYEASQNLAALADAEYDNLVQSQNIESANMALGITAGCLGIAGIAIEVGASGVSSYLSGDDVGKAAYKSVCNALPLDSAGLVKDYFDGKNISLYDCFTSVLMDGVKIMGLKNDIAEMKSMKSLVSVPDNCVDDFVQSMQNVSKGEQVFMQGLKGAKKKVQDFLDLHHSCQLDAIKKGRLFDISDYPNLKSKFWDVQSDKSSIFLLNQGGDEIADMFNLPKKTVLSKFNGLKDSIYKKNNDKIADTLKNRYKNSFKGEIEVKPLFATNPSTQIKASYDQDITYSIVDKNTGEVLRDIGEDELQDLVADVYYKDNGSLPASVWDPDGISNIIEPNASEAKRFAIWNDQIAVSHGAEAYGKGAPSLGFLNDSSKSGLFINKMEYGNTFKYKGNHAGNYADRIQNEIDRQKNLGNLKRVEELLPYKQKFEIEQCRQWSKQINSHVKPALDTVQDVCARYGIKAPKMPPDRLTKAIEIMGDIGSRGPDGRFVTPEAAEVMIKGLGFRSLAEAGNNMGDYLLAFEKSVQGNSLLVDKLKILENSAR